MGISCLNGHSWGDTQRERKENSETGRGVVRAERVYQECTNCGQEKTIKERTIASDTVSPNEGNREQNTLVDETTDTTATMNDTSTSYSDQHESGNDGVEIMETPEPADESTANQPSTSDRSESWDSGSEQLDGQEGTRRANSSEFTQDELQKADGGLVPSSEESDVEILSHDSDGSDSGRAEPLSDEDTESQSQAANPDWESTVSSPNSETIYCPSCSFEQTEQTSSVTQGDACPECQTSFLRVS